MVKLLMIFLANRSRTEELFTWSSRATVLKYSSGGVAVASSVFVPYDANSEQIRSILTASALRVSSDKLIWWQL